MNMELVFPEDAREAQESPAREDSARGPRERDRGVETRSAEHAAQRPRDRDERHEDERWEEPVSRVEVRERRQERVGDELRRRGRRVMRSSPSESKGIFSSLVAVLKEVNSGVSSEFERGGSGSPRGGVERSRARGGCLGAEGRRRTRGTAKSRGEPSTGVDPRVSEWGNPPRVMPGHPPPNP